MNDLDFGDLRRNKRAMGLLAVRRFTGHEFTTEELERITAADTGYRIDQP
ncbi:hypothetical protein Val02_62290 [Virgisporangium aliadipatigenens]|uniref:Uncharacterized protein n=1 Tax=Virgisporangium aliadipatigenens TaxID=741659 RepID=A0A8J3YT92_9ACTN|nr:hypothetical protein [Virgisporangium aliadipatigenens]GIJ49343.1 hypothetical protein Val02_62290 [Virgisporangium aliadipatigenens]